MRKDKTVKIDSELLKEIEEFIKKNENRLRYSSIKQFIDIAVLEKLKRRNNEKLAK
jgi:metal-responsive CopG/Arc/MetJ family transcriptional regulator